MNPTDDELVDLYRRLPRAEPSAALDAAVLAQARAALRPHRPTWLLPTAAAAAAVLAVGVGWQLRHEPLRETVPAVAPAPSATSTAETRAAPTAGAAAQDAQDAQAERHRAEAAPIAPTAPAPPPASPAADALPAPQRAQARAMQEVAPAPAPAPSPEPADEPAATAEPAPEPAPAPEPEQRIARDAAEHEVLETLVVTGNRIGAPSEASESPAPTVAPFAGTAATPPPAPAPSATPVPPIAAEPPSAAVLAAPKAASAERALGASADRPADAIAAAFDAIRALRDAGRRDEAIEALQRMLDDDPALEVPEDLRDLRR